MAGLRTTICLGPTSARYKSSEPIRTSICADWFARSPVCSFKRVHGGQGPKGRGWCIGPHKTLGRRSSVLVQDSIPVILSTGSHLIKGHKHHEVGDSVGTGQGASGHGAHGAEDMHGPLGHMRLRGYRDTGGMGREASEHEACETWGYEASGHEAWGASVHGVHGASRHGEA